MKLRNVLLLLFAFAMLVATAQPASNPYKGTFVCKMARITLCLDAYGENIEVPGLSFLGKTNGYLSGTGVYGIWMITNCEKQGDALRIRLSNDTGSDSQTVIFKQVNDSIFSYIAVGGNVIKKVQHRKLVKIEDTLEFQLKK